MYSRKRPQRPPLTAILFVLTISWLWPAAGAWAQDGTAWEPGEFGASGYDGGFFFESADGDFRLEIGGRVQTQLRVLLKEEGDEHSLDELGLMIRRARLKLDGHALTPRLDYQFQADFGRGDVDLLEYYANWAFVEGLVEGRVGKWRYPFLRQEITSSGSLLLVDRSLVGDVFGDDYDVGVGLHNDFTDAPTFEWVVGVFNGTTSELNAIDYDQADGGPPSLFTPAIVARAAYNHGDISPYREGDIGRSPFGFALGAAVSAEPGIERPEQSAVRATVDYVLKVRGFSTSGALMAATVQEGEGFGDQELFATGLFVQAGYLIGQTIQPAVRYSMIDFGQGEGGLSYESLTDLSDNLRKAISQDGRIHEALAGLNVYFYGHRFKWQTDAGAIITETSNDTAHYLQARTQLQLSF